MVKIAVFVSGSGTNLQSIIDACEKKEINGEIVLVVSSKKDAYGLERAKNHGIEGKFLRQEDKIIEELKNKKVDLIVLAGYLSIVTDKLIELYPNKIINIHPALIPSFCGKGYYGHYVHEAVFKRGVKVSGATVHFVSNVVDGGPIILQKAIDISDCATPEEIAEKILVNIEHKLLVEAVKLYCDNKLQIENERVNII